MMSALLAFLFLASTNAQRGYDRSGYDGDNFSLEGAIELFKNSRSIDDFERRLNTEDTWVNNLDLNYDGRIDYIRVEHIRQGDLHAIVLQVPINRHDVHDVAVIEIEKVGRRKAILQIIGDEDLYGQELIVEPYEGDGYSNGRGGPSADYDFRRGYVNVYYWTPVRHIFGRRYRPYISPYRWSYYPTWWSPWRQCGWDVFRPRVVIYNRFYHVVSIHRVVRVHNFYRPYRAYCPNVFQRSNQIRVNQGRPAIRRDRVSTNRNRRNIQNGNQQRSQSQINNSRSRINQRAGNQSSSRRNDNINQRATNANKRNRTSSDINQRSKTSSKSNAQNQRSKVRTESRSRTQTKAKSNRARVTKPSSRSNPRVNSRSKTTKSRTSTSTSRTRSKSKVNSPRKSRSSSTNAAKSKSRNSSRVKRN